MKRTKDGYIQIKMPEHPAAGSDGYVYEHRLVAERAIGKFLPKTAVVHHVNENPSDNRPENLAVFPDLGYHRFMHARLRLVRAGGNPRTEKLCRTCDTVKAKSEFSARRGGRFDKLQSSCRSCNSAACAAAYKRRTSR